MGQTIAQLEERIAMLEAAMGMGGEGEAFIGSQLRPDLIGAPDYSGQGDLQRRMASGDRDAKLAFDTPPSR
jgi:immune inhibitor A